LVAGLGQLRETIAAGCIPVRSADQTLAQTTPIDVQWSLPGRAGPAPVATIKKEQSSKVGTTRVGARKPPTFGQQPTRVSTTTHNHEGSP
jgi:hypothetical protein